MQTFLPYADFQRSAESLDVSRLGKQRVETLQILRALELPEYGWANHPAVRMWRGYTPALVLYGLICARTWLVRGHADSTEAQIAEFAPDVAKATQDELASRQLLPPWLGDEALHMSHRSKLVTKDPDHYGAEFAGTPRDLDYRGPSPSSLLAERPLHTPYGGSSQGRNTVMNVPQFANELRGELGIISVAITMRPRPSEVAAE